MTPDVGHFELLKGDIYAYINNQVNAFKMCQYIYATVLEYTYQEIIPGQF